jgi:uncharacterized protein YegL
MKNTTAFTFSRVQFDKPNEVHLVISLTAPAIDWQAKRAPICVIPCLDISGSMMGNKLEYAKQSCLKLIDHLQPGDYAGIVTFESSVQLVSPVVKITQASKDALKAKIGNLRVAGMTNFSGGMTLAVEQANKADLAEGTITRVVMFTDGNPNQGVATRSADIVTLLDKVIGRATVSAFGYGEDAAQDLLSDLAKSGKGNYAFIKNPEDALSAFAKELGGLLSVYAQNVKINLGTHGEHKVTEVLSDVDVEEHAEGVKITVPDILSEETRHIVVAMKLAKQTQAFPRTVSIADVVVEYDVLDDTGKTTHKSEVLKAKLKFVKAGEAQEKADPALDKIVGLAQMVKVQLDAEEKVKHGDYAGASQALHAFSVSTASRGLGAISNVSQNLSASYGTAASYNTSQGYTKSVLRSASGSSFGTYTSDAAALADMESIGSTASNSIMNAMTKEFTAPVAPATSEPTTKGK